MPPCSAFLRFFLIKSATPICCAQTFKTATVDNSLDPRWNETFTYDLPLAGASQTPYAELKCVFAVFDRDILSADDQLNYDRLFGGLPHRVCLFPGLLPTLG